MPTTQQKKVVFTLYRNIFRFCKALDRNGPNAVQMQMSKLNAHLYIPTVYTSLAQSAMRAYPKKVIQESENACSAAKALFRMPLPPNDYEATQEINYRMDMAFAAIKFMNDQYQHVVEQKSDVIDSRHWTEILQRKDRIEDGAIAIARIADPSLQADVVHDELDRIAHLVQNELAADTPSATSDSTVREGAEEREALDLSKREEDDATLSSLERAVDTSSALEDGGDAERGAADVSRREGDAASSQWTRKVLNKLNKVFFRDLGFKGNRDDYYDPRNSIIHEVLANRTGNPITLSVAYMAVARRLGVPLYGAECPSHFVVRGYHADGETFFVDVFNSGAIMTLKGVKDLYLAKNQLVDLSDLEPAAPMRIYARMMRNLVNAHMIIGKGDKALLWTERIRALEHAASAIEN